MKKDDCKTPIVSIWCLTYNHASFIRDAIEGFLAQETTFPYEIVIHDDASTDGTTEILKEYESRYPDLIKVIYREKNLYNHPKRNEIIKKTKQEVLKGKYLALCEGDDFWIDASKLQKQVDYMEAHEGCVLTMHNAELIDYEKKETRKMDPYSETGVVNADHIILQRNGIFPTASYLLRKEVWYPDEFFFECGIGDWPMQLFCLTKGYIYYFHEPMSVYRFMHTGSWSAKTYGLGKENLYHSMKMIAFLLKYNEYTESKYYSQIISRMNQFIGTIGSIYQEIGEEDYFALFQRFHAETKNKYRECEKEISRIIKQMIHYEVNQESVMRFCEDSTGVVVWGTGKYAERYTRFLNEMKVEILGYHITKKSVSDEMFMDKKVWDNTDFPYKGSDVKVVVAVGLAAWTEIVLSLEELGIKNYYSPFIPIV